MLAYAWPEPRRRRAATRHDPVAAAEAARGTSAHRQPSHPAATIAAAARAHLPQTPPAGALRYAKPVAHHALRQDVLLLQVQVESPRQEEHRGQAVVALAVP